MKSIMEQASSIMKAIEKAWISAENPKEFSVKIFEKEEKNFFGMTTKPAKIGIFFSQNKNNQEKSIQEKSTAKEKPQAREQLVEEKTEKPVDAPKQQQKPFQPVKQAQTPKNPTENRPARPEKVKTDTVKAEQPRRVQATWNDAMISKTTTWIANTLSLMGMQDTDFKSEVAGKNLKLTFAKPILENQIVEKQLFRSLAHLVMSSLRNQHKQEIKDLKIVLIRPE